MKQILFPFDFSKNSLNAFRYALHLAQNINAEITTLHVYEPAPRMYTNYYELVLANYGIGELAEFENFKGKVPKLRQIAEKENCTQVVVRHVLVQGEVVPEILKRAKSEKTNCIVMGTTGATGLRETFLGSVTEKVMNLAKCTVLAIPESAKYRPIKNILFLSKFKETDIPHLLQVQKTAKVFEAQVKVLNVKKHHEENDNISIAKFKSAVPGSDIHYHILASNEVEGTIADFMEIDSTDLIVMPVHHKTFLNNLFLYSLSKQLVFHSKVPILGLHQDGPGLS